MIGLASSSQVAITIIVIFPCLLIFSVNIFNTGVMAMFPKVAMFIFLENLCKCHNFISACFYQSIRGEIVPYCFLIFLISNCSWCYFFFFFLSLRLPYFPLCLESSLNLCIIWWGKTHSFSGKNEWPPFNYYLNRYMS